MHCLQFSYYRHNIVQFSENGFTSSIHILITYPDLAICLLDFSCFVVLELCCNQLTGSIPEEMGSLKRLTVIALQSNKLDGEIPSSLGKLEMLRRLDLGFNNFFGPIPATVANASQLQVLDVRNNSLSGMVPSGRFCFFV